MAVTEKETGVTSRDKHGFYEKEIVSNSILSGVFTSLASLGKSTLPPQL